MALCAKTGLQFNHLARVGLAVSVLMVTACSSEAPKLSAVGAASSVVAGPGSPSLSPEEVAQSGPAAAFNPFGDLSTAAPGGREVISNPTLADVLAPVGPLAEMSIGREDAPVVIVQYASLTCPYCKQFHNEVFPALKRDYIDTGKVRYILRDFPIGRTSGQASIALRCAPAHKHLELYGKFLNQQAAWVSQDVRLDPIYAVAAQVGITRTQFDACRTDVALVESIKAMKDRGRKLGIIGTPNFFVQDKLIKKAVDMAELKSLIESQSGVRPSASISPNQ